MGRKLAMSAKELKAYIREWAGKKTPYEMHVDIGVNVRTICCYASEISVSLVPLEKQKRMEDLKQAIRDYGETHTAGEIAAMLKVPRSTVFYKGWKMGIRFKAERSKLPPSPERAPGIKFFNVFAHENWIV